MSAVPDPFAVRRPFRDGVLYSLPALEERGLGRISRLPVCIRVVLESLVRNCDGRRVTEADVRALAAYAARQPSTLEIPFVVSRIVLQDFTGVPLLVDLAAMRDAVRDQGGDPALIEPLVPVDLVVDHSVQVDRSGTAAAFQQNLDIEFARNRERYEFLKWGQQAFQTFSVVPPAIGIVHQVNLEYLAKVVFEKDGVYYPDSLVGTDSHTTMINGLGIVGWGVGGIEAEAGMLGQPIAFQTPEVIGVHLAGRMREGVTATDLTLRITQLLRQANVVGKFVEFFGAGAASLPLPDRATIANMAPEYGATMGFFPIDELTLEYLRMTGRDEAQIDLVRAYTVAQGMFGMPGRGAIDYSTVLDLDLDSIVPSVAGPKRPQDRIDLGGLKRSLLDLYTRKPQAGGFGLAPADLDRRAEVRLDAAEPAAGAHHPDSPELPANGRPGATWSEVEMVANRPTAAAADEASTLPGKVNGSVTIRHGSVLIAAITSCTNTSNPSVMLAAGLLARKAVERGLKVPAYVKTSLAPGSRVVTEYLRETGLQPYLDQLGFHLVGYGCTTCIGNSGPLADVIEEAIDRGNLVAASVLSGNRNFEARVHSAIKANFLMSPPLVVAFALAGRVDIDLTSEPLGTGADGEPVFLRDIWPSNEEIQATVAAGIQPRMYTSQYSDILEANPNWKQIPTGGGALYNWSESSTYIRRPPFFDGFTREPPPPVAPGNMRALAILGDSVTTDHISPAGSIPADGPAGRYLRARGVEPEAFNSFGSRRGNDAVMTRGTFANVRIKNRMAGGREGGYTALQPDGAIVAIHDACEHYRAQGVPLIVFAGHDYGMGSSRDWAAKGTRLLGVRVVVACSYERIHRSNLIGMGVLPLQFADGASAASLGLDGSELFSLEGLAAGIRPGQDAVLVFTRRDGSSGCATLRVRIDTAIELAYYQHGGILPYVLRSILPAS
jgi:aconitate hydratase